MLRMENVGERGLALLGTYRRGFRNTVDGRLLPIIPLPVSQPETPQATPIISCCHRAYGYRSTTSAGCQEVHAPRHEGE